MTIGPIGEAIVSRIATVSGRVQLSLDGRYGVLTQLGRDPLIVDLEKPVDPISLPASLNALFVSISPDGKWVATGGWNDEGNHRVKIWTMSGGKLAVSLPISLDADVAFSPDNRWLVTSTADEYCFWEVGTWKARRRMPSGNDVPGHIVFAPDSRLAAVSSLQMGVRLVDIETATEIATLEDEGDERPLGFSPDSGQLATRGRNSTIRLWDLRLLRAELAKMGLDWPHPPIPPGRPQPAIKLTLR